MIRIARHIALFATGLLMMGAQAQTIESMKAEPTRAAVGQPVKLTTQFVVANSINCKVRVHFGDGNFTDFMVNQTKDVPLVLEHSYAKAGKYTTRVEGRGAAHCMGNAINVDVEVQNKGAVAVATPTSAVAAVACPAGWNLTKAGVNKKTGAFTCAAKPNSPVAEPRTTCPGDLTYFENVKKGQLGCRV